MRQAAENNYGAADTEDNGAQNNTIYDLNRIFYQQILPVSVRDLSKASIKYEPGENRGAAISMDYQPMSRDDLKPNQFLQNPTISLIV